MGKSIEKRDKDHDITKRRTITRGKKRNWCGNRSLLKGRERCIRQAGGKVGRKERWRRWAVGGMEMRRKVKCYVITKNIRRLQEAS